MSPAQRERGGALAMFAMLSLALFAIGCANLGPLGRPEARGAAQTFARSSAPPVVIVPRASPTAWRTPSAPTPAEGTREPAAPARVGGSVPRVVLGLLALLVCALLAAHPAVQSFEKRAGFGMIAATGIPFFALGAIARSRSVAVLTEDIVRDLRPVLEFGLGWLGFRVGIAFDVRALERLPRGAFSLLGAESVAAFVFVTVCAGAVMTLQGGDLASGSVLRDALVLGACASVSAPTGARALLGAGVLNEAQSKTIRRIAALEDGIAVAALALVAGAFRPVTSGTWSLPPLGWVFLQMGMGAALGALTVAFVRATRDTAERVALTLGAMAFTAGVAGYMGFPPMVVGAFAGLVAANTMEGESARSFSEDLRTLERPIYMIFFAMAGAVWQSSDSRGWVLVPVFVLARIVGKLFGASGAMSAPSAYRDAADPTRDARVREAGFVSLREVPLRYVGLSLVPTSAISVAAVVSARQTYGSQLAPHLETVVVGSALVGELLLQLIARALQRADAPGLEVVWAENETLLRRPEPDTATPDASTPALTESPDASRPPAGGSTP